MSINANEVSNYYIHYPTKTQDVSDLEFYLLHIQQETQGTHGKLYSTNSTNCALTAEVRKDTTNTKQSNVPVQGAVPVPHQY